MLHLGFGRELANCMQSTASCARPDDGSEAELTKRSRLYVYIYCCVYIYIYEIIE